MISGGLRTKGIIKQSQEGMPLITVITVVRNGEKTLEKTILSVINQTYKNIEYIIVDGASTDGTLDIIRKYEDNIDYWTSEPDKGIYDAMNKGVDLATGDWINFMNSGDRFYKNYIVNDLLKEINHHEIFYGDYIDKDEIVRKSPRRISTIFFLMERMICHQVIFARKEILSKYPFDGRYQIVADRKFLIQCHLKNYNMYYIPIPVCLRDDLGVSSNKKQFKMDSLKLILEFYGYWGLLFAKTKRFIGCILRLVQIIVVQEKIQKNKYLLIG